MFQKTLLAASLVFLISSIGTAQMMRDSESTIRERAVRIEPFIRESSKRYGIDPQLLRILCFIESRYRLDAVSPKGARGPMQFMPETAKRFGLKNPQIRNNSIDAAARYLRNLMRTFGGRLDLALAAYNAGEGTVESFRTGRPLVLASGKIINRRGRVTGGIPPYRETQDYVRSAITFFTNGRITSLQPTSLSLQKNSASLPLSSRHLKLNSANGPTPASRRGNDREHFLFIEVQ